MKLSNLFKTSLTKKLSLILGSKKTKEEVFEELEEQLILSDISMELVQKILGDVKKNSKLTFEKEDFFKVLREELKTIMLSTEKREETLPDGKKIIMLVGINGSGKTTSAAKIAYFHKTQGKKVLMAAADTFRAAGSSQLSLWGERLDIPVIGAERGADPGSVVYNSLSSFSSKDYDVLVVDTAGRVQTRENLMKELEKITKIVKKFYPSGPTDTLLVVDATMGQNTLDQARKFKTFSGITGLVLAKLDGSAKGGTVINIIHEMRIPVKYIGTGETQADIETFSVDEFIDSLLSE